MNEMIESIKPIIFAADSPVKRIAQIDLAMSIVDKKLGKFRGEGALIIDGNGKVLEEISFDAKAQEHLAPVIEWLKSERTRAQAEQAETN